MSKTTEKVSKIVTCGCSYMKHHADGHGVKDLATRLGITNRGTHAMDGLSNSAIIRLTVADSMQATEPTLYIVSTTYLNRFELPILKKRNNEKWGSFGNATPLDSREYDECVIDLSKYVDLHLQYTINSVKEHIYALYLQLAMMIDSVKSRGHKIVVFNSAEELLREALLLDPTDIKFLDNYNAEIIQNLHWLSIPWQHEQGVKSDPEDIRQNIPFLSRHPATGEHRHLNKFLVDYINTNKILC